MAVDWSIFWNNIFPGLILIVSSSIGAYIVVHRYQRRKHEKEIRDDLIRQEHELLNIYWNWMRFISDFLIRKPITKDEIDKTMNLSDKAFDKLREKITEIVEYSKLMNVENTDEEEKTQLKKQVDFEIKKLVEADRNRLLELRTAIEERQYQIEYFSTITDELTIGANLFLKRLINQLGTKKEELGFFDTFNSEVRELEAKIMTIIDSEMTTEEINQLRKESMNISKFFVKAETLILQSRIKF